MDVERSVQFLLDSQAKYQARAEARFDKLDRKIGGITKLVQQGMRLLVAQQKHTAKLDKALAELALSQAELAESQKATDRTLRAFMDSMRKGRNGH